MPICRLCRADCELALDLGSQPISLRLLTAADAPEATHRRLLGQCSLCGLVQAIDPPTPEELRPGHDWITFTEIDAHLDRVVDRIASLPGIAPSSRIWGLSFKDDTLLARLQARSFTNTFRPDAVTDLGIREPGAGIETLQARLDRTTLTTLARQRGKPEVLLARHLLEHAHDIGRLLAALRELLEPSGYLVVEVPDSARGMERCDYSMLWEEHVQYFTPTTFRNASAHAGFSLVHLEQFPYPMEDALVAVVRADGAATLTTDSLGSEKARARAFAASLPDVRARVQAFLSHVPSKVALFGAGHRGAVYVNLLGLGLYLEFVADDHPKKRGLFLPGSRLPVRASAELTERGVDLCLLTVSPASEEKVMRANARFTQAGGTFASIYPDSPHALRI